MADNDGSGILWFLAGLGIGAALGILYAPKTGEETRQQIRDAADQGREAMKERARQAKEQVRSAYEAGRQAYREATTEEGETAASKL